MKAYVFDGKEKAKLEERPAPNIIKQSDVIVKIEKNHYLWYGFTYIKK